jgi:hypothetical protein
MRTGEERAGDGERPSGDSADAEMEEILLQLLCQGQFEAPHEVFLVQPSLLLFP